MEPDQAPALVDIPEYARTLAVEWFGEPSAPLLFRAVNLEMWDICRRLLTERDTETSCKELRYVDLYGYSALHYASWWSASAPLDVLQSIIQHTERHFSSLPNRKGRTPLHLAAWRGRDEVVEILAEKCPEAAGVMDRTHKTPLVDACFRNRSRNVLQALVKADPDQIKQSNHCGRSAASLFFRISYGFVSLPTRTRFQEEQEQEIFLAKSKVILAAERIALDKEPLNFDEDVNLVHAAMDSPSCPFPVVKYLLEKLDDGTIRDFRDSCGDTFLHIASKADRFHFESFFQCDRCQESANAFEELQIMHFNRDPESPHWGARCSNASCRKSSRPLMIHYVQVPVETKEREMISYLLRRCPSLALIPDLTGRIPMEVALSSGRTWHSGIKEFVLADSRMLTRRDQTNGLYPFQAVACLQADNYNPVQPPVKKRKLSGDEKDSPKVSDSGDGKLAYNPYDLDRLATIYQLLRDCPYLVPDV